MEEPVLGVEVAVLMGEGARGRELEPRSLERAADLRRAVLFGDSKLDLSLEHGGYEECVEAISRSAPGCTSHSSVPCAGPGALGKVTSAAPPFLYTTVALHLSPTRRYEVHPLRS